MLCSEIKALEKHVYLSSPTMHGEELQYMKLAYDTNWMSTVGENIDAVEKIAAEKTGRKYAVGLCNCTAALHLAVIILGEKIYGKPSTGHGCLEGHRVFCSDMTFAATLNPVIYEGGEPVFIDTDPSTWNMSPEALEKAFELYPEVKLVVMAHLYGYPADIIAIRETCDRHGALLLEDAAEALGATVYGRQCGSFGDISTVSYNGNKVITGSSGGCLLTDDPEVAEHVKKLSTQARDAAPWYQHSEIGYNYRMSNVIAGIIRGQYPHLQEHIAQKKAVYERYKKGFEGLPLSMNPILDRTVPNYWLSAAVINPSFVCSFSRTDLTSEYIPAHGKSCPTEILKSISSVNAEGRPIWKPMHLQPVFEGYAFVKSGDTDAGADIFSRGICLPSDNKLTPDEQDTIIAAVRACFD